MASRSSGVSEKISEKDCSICLDQIGTQPKYAQLDCSHVFHKKCIEQWNKLTLNKACPDCHAPEPKVTINKVPKSETEKTAHMRTSGGRKNVEQLKSSTSADGTARKVVDATEQKFISNLSSIPPYLLRDPSRVEYNPDTRQYRIIPRFSVYDDAL